MRTSTPVRTSALGIFWINGWSVLFSRVQVQAGGAAVPLAALIAALHPLDQLWRKWRRRRLCWSSVLTAEGGGQSPGGTSWTCARGLWSSALWSQQAVPALLPPLSREDGVNVEHLSSGPPPSRSSSSRAAGLGPVQGFTGGAGSSVVGGGGDLREDSSW